MRRALILFLLVLSVAACTQRRTPAAYKGLVIKLTDSILVHGGSDTIRFGHLRPGEIAVLGFRLSNASARTVAVTSYGRSCGCTTLEYDSEPITPGGAQQMSLRFDSRGERGWQLKTVDLHLAGAGQPLRLFIEAEVE